MVRLKHRYFLTKVVFNDNRCGHDIETFQIYIALNKIIKSLHGDFGLACTSLSLSVKYINAYTSIVLLRVRRDHQKILASSLPFLTELYNPKDKKITRCFFQTIHCAGTIRSCQKALIKYHRKQLQLLNEEKYSPREKKIIEKSLLSSTLIGGEDSE